MRKEIQHIRKKGKIKGKIMIKNISHAYVIFWQKDILDTCIQHMIITLASVKNGKNLNFIFKIVIFRICE